ncbi:hypothetical protein NMG60_11013039 [Bertholletia excelsa]
MAKQNVKLRANSTSTQTNTSMNRGSVMKVKRRRKTFPRDSPPQRSSIYRGVTRHRWTGRYEAHLWDKDCWNESQNKKGRQGAYDDEEAAAHAYDLAALKYWGEETILNFPLPTYQKELKEMEGVSREEYIGSLRRKSNGFSRGASKYRGVARHHHNGRWEARIGRVFGNKYLYLGTYATQEEAAIAYDMAAIEYRGLNAVTNFDLSRYIKWLRPNTTATAANLPKPNLENNLSALIHNKELELNLHEQHAPQPSINTATDSVVEVAQPAQQGTATSALGLLLQSSKFKEMMEMTSAAEYPPPLRESPTPDCSLSSDYIDTCFESQDFGLCGGRAGEDVIFNDLDSLIYDA